MGERLKQILVIIATLGVILVNWLAATGQIYNVTPEIISDRYPTLITPAGYAFSIWSLIYLGLIAFSIFQALPSQKENPRFRRIRSLYIANCTANCVWIYLWHQEAIPASLVIMLVLLVTLILINVTMQNTDSTAELWLAKIPFNIYFGWITVATIINFAVALVYWGVQMSDFTANIVACALITAAVVLGIIIRLKLGIVAYPLTIAWALTAIAVKQSIHTPIVIVSAIGVILLLIAALSAFLQNKTQTK